MATIDHNNMIDLRDLVKLAIECGEEIEDTDTDPEDVTDSKETLVKLSYLAALLGYATNEEDAEDVADGLERAANSYGCLIAEDHFTAYAREYVEETNEIPEFLQNHVDWDSLASELMSDYTTITLDGEDYYLR